MNITLVELNDGGADIYNFGIGEAKEARAVIESPITDYAQHFDKWITKAQIGDVFHYGCGWVIITSGKDYNAMTKKL